MNINQIALLFTVCLLVLVDQTNTSEYHGRDFTNVDVFNALKVDEYQMQGYEMSRLNDFLIARTSSTDPVENLEIVMDGLISDNKKKNPDYRAVQAKRLVSALSTLEGENECSYFSYLILYANFRALALRADKIIKNTGLKRIDRVVAHYIKKRLDNCRQVIFKNYDEISKNLDGTLMGHLDKLVASAMKKFTSKKGNSDADYVERLFQVVSDPFSLPNNVELDNIYNVLKDLAQDDPDGSFVLPVENEHTGRKSINRGKFDQLYRKYIVKPCEYIEETFGPDVFEQAIFYSKFDRRVQADKVDFYETWLKYRLCSSYLFEEAQWRIINYVESQTSN